MNNKNKIVSALIKGKKTIYNMTVKFNKTTYQLGGIGPKKLKVVLRPPKECPNFEVVAFLPWDKWDSFSDREKEIVEMFYSNLQQ